MLNNTSNPLDPSVLRGIPSQGFASLGQVQGNMQGLQQMPSSYGMPGGRPPMASGMPTSGGAGPNLLGLGGALGGPPGASQPMQGRVGMQPSMGGGSQPVRNTWAPLMGSGGGLGGAGASLGAAGAGRAMGGNPPGMGRGGSQPGLGPMDARMTGALGAGVGGASTSGSVGRMPAMPGGVGPAAPGAQRMGPLVGPASGGFVRGPGQQDQLMAILQHKNGGQPNHLQGPPGSLGRGFAGLAVSGPQFDASEFPSLGLDGSGVGPGTDMSQSGRGAGLGAGLGADYAAMAMQSLHKAQAPEFSDSDFPALPGSIGAASGGASQPGDLGGARIAQGPKPGSAANIVAGAMVQSQGQGHAGQGQGPADEMHQLSNWGMMAARSMPAGATPDKLKAQMGAMSKPVRQAEMTKQDRYGMTGLLSLIQMNDMDLTTLALGTDLTTLGLNLNSQEHLYMTFASPWAEAPLRPDQDFVTPACFNQHTPPKLLPGSMHKFRTETLLYAFYSMPGEEAQLLAADELSTRGWAFHRQLKMWLKRAPGTEPASTSEQEEQGTFVLFDPKAWKEVTRTDLVVRYAELERPPALPRPPGASGMPGGGPPTSGPSQ